MSPKRVPGLALGCIDSRAGFKLHYREIIKDFTDANAQSVILVWNNRR